MVVVSFKDLKPPVDFWLPEDTTNLTVLRSLLNNMLPHTENKKVDKIEFCAPWIDTGENVKYNNVGLKIGEDLNVMWRTYHRWQIKGLVECDTKIARFVDDIIKMLKHLESSSSV